MLTMKNNDLEGDFGVESLLYRLHRRSVRREKGELVIVYSTGIMERASRCI